MRKVLFLALLLITVSGLASANTVTFETGFASTGGTISTSGVGSAILLGDLFDLGACSGFCDITDGTLDFDGSNLTIVGGVSSLGIGTGTTLFTGTYGSQSTSCDATSCAVVFNTTITGSFDPTLAAALGLAGSHWSLTGGSLAQYDAPTGLYIVDSTSVAFSPTPEPASLLLLGSGIGALCAIYRRKR